MGEVRRLIDALVGKEHDQRDPAHRPRRAVVESLEVAQELVVRLHAARESVDAALEAVDGGVGAVLQTVEYVQSAFIPSLGLVPFKGSKAGPELVAEFEGLFAALRRARAEVEESHHCAAFEDAEAYAVAIDSDEEDRLFRELDQALLICT